VTIEFVCNSCQSKHAAADHMAGKQFRCGGCGKILTVPLPGQEASAPAPRPQPVGRGADEAALDPGEERGEAAMSAGVQTTLLIFGGVVVVVMLLLGCGAVLLGVPIFIARPAVPPPVMEEAPAPVAPPDAPAMKHK
jgi:hypothetical protein